MGTRRVALKPHAAKIRRWVDEGRGDEWIAQELNTTPSSVQSFRSRNSIYRRDPVRRGQVSEHPVVIEESGSGILLKTDLGDSDVFAREWRSYLGAAPGGWTWAIARLGAQHEGVLRKHKQRRDGSWRDTHLFSMLDTEWPEAVQALERRLSR